MLKNLTFLATAIVLLGLTCASTRAQEQAPSPENSTEVTTGAITGQIVNDRGEPMPGATVFVRPLGAPNAGRSAATDGEGRFRLTGLEAGLYILTGHAPAYVFQPPPEAAATTYYRIGDSARLEIVKGGVITGTVVNPNGEPLVGVRVHALMLRDSNGKIARTPQYGFMERVTDDRGIYRIYGLSPGTYIVGAGGGQGYRSSQLNPYEGDVPTYAPSATRDGATEFTVRSGEETTADIRYRNDPGRTVSGTVKLIGAANGASVMLMPADGSFMPAANAVQAPGARGFELSGVGDGEYQIRAMEFPATAGGLTLPEISISETKRISVKGADVSGIELITRPASSLSGRISLESSKAPECQGKRKPLFVETLVELQRHEKDSEPIPGFMRVMGGAVSPDPKGTFVFRNLSAGRYRLNPTFYARFWYLQSISIGAPSTATAPAAKNAPPKIDPAANWTTIKSGDQITNVTITLAEGAASIRGRVPMAEGATIPPGTAVYLVPAEADKATDVLRYFVTNVASDGTFALNSLAPGRYWSVLQSPVQSEIGTLVKLRSPESAEARTKLRRTAESQKSDVELKPCQTLSDYKLSLK